MRTIWQRYGSRILLSLTIWVLVGVWFAGQIYFFYASIGQKMAWRDALTWELSRWLPWCLLTPLAVWFARRYPLETANKRRSLLIHVPASIVFSCALIVLFTVSVFLTLVVPSLKLTNLDLSTLRGVVLPAAWKTLQRGFLFNFHFGIIVYGVILVGSHALNYYRRSAKLESQLAQAQLKALKMQLHPHFLFNTLNSISGLLHEDVDAANEMIGSLGDFLRLTLENSGAQEVRLEEELAFLRAYLEIEHFRLHDRLTTKFEIEPETLSAQVPNLILQPIIENAVRHGIAPHAKPGLIEIKSIRIAGRLRMQIRDSGPGLTMSSGNGGSTREGVGLTNTRARLKQLYGSNYSFDVANSLLGGLQVTLEIPFETTSAEPQRST